MYPEMWNGKQKKRHQGKIMSVCVSMTQYVFTAEQRMQHNEAQDTAMIIEDENKHIKKTQHEGNQHASRNK